MWDGIGDFIAMGGHGPYVWGSYGVFAMVLLAEVSVLARRRHRIRTILARRSPPGAASTWNQKQEESLEP